ncbi:transketolase [Clostridia bacterium]|nr:transketolase [Clostridia bacterium]
MGIEIATRMSYGNALCELGATHENMAVLDADLAGATMTKIFRDKYPERFFNCGIAEQNMMGVAAGLAAAGKLVFASSFAMFAAGRAYEIIRNSIGNTGLNVKIAATHAGVAVGEDGASHQCVEDVMLMRAIPGMTIINPADDIEARAATLAMADFYGPTYLRLGRLPVPIINDFPEYKFRVGEGVVLRSSPEDSVTIISTGLVVERALGAHKILRDKGIFARVINIHTIKPLDDELILRAAAETGRIVVAEEHLTCGGLGSAVCEAVLEKKPVPVKRIGINDVFGYSGPALELLKIFGLTAENIAAVAEDFLKQ